MVGVSEVTVASLVGGAQHAPLPEAILARGSVPVHVPATATVAAKSLHCLDFAPSSRAHIAASSESARVTGRGFPNSDPSTFISGSRQNKPLN